MTLVRWSPLGLRSTRDFSRDFSRMAEDMDRLFGPFFATRNGDEIASFAPPVDVEENAEEFVLRVDLPGISLSDVKVHLMGEVLTIRGERRGEKNDGKNNLHRSERVYGSFERSFTLGVPVHGDKVLATYKDGVLEVRVPKAEEARVREIQVQSA